MQVPVFDLRRQNAALMQDLEETFCRVVSNGQFILGEPVERLEEAVAAHVGVAHAIGVGNCSDALYLALRACGVGPGDEVITTPFTFFASAGSIARAGARPVFVDIEDETLNIDAQLVEERVTSKTKAILAVHLYGQTADMTSLRQIAKRHGLYLVEDAAQAIGACHQGIPAGRLGDIACFSFFPTKNLGCFGDGGMVVTDNDDLAEVVRRLRVHGAKPKYFHSMLGINSRLDTLQAAILQVKWPHLDEWITARRRIAHSYDALLEGLPLQRPVERPGNFHVYHQYTIRLPERDKLQEYLREKGIGTAVYYPLSLHLQEVFSYLGYSPGDLPQAEKAQREVLSLPMFPELQSDEIEYVATQVRAFFEGTAS